MDGQEGPVFIPDPILIPYLAYALVSLVMVAVLFRMPQTNSSTDEFKMALSFAAAGAFAPLAWGAPNSQLAYRYQPAILLAFVLWLMLCLVKLAWG